MAHDNQHTRRRKQHTRESQNNKTHTQKKKVQLHPTWIGALGMCLRYPVPCLAAFMPWKFLRGMDHQPSGGGYSTNVVFILLSEHTNFFRKGYPRRKHIQSRGGDPPSCIGQPRLGLLEFTVWPPQPPPPPPPPPPISPCHQLRRRPPVRLSGLGQQE